MFELVSEFKPLGDQPKAIENLADKISEGLRAQVLVGITGSGKTFTMANVIAKINKPTLVLAHNKILAAQLYQEFKTFFPKNSVEYFVSYYDYYQPEAYIPRTDTYIEKDLAINDQIDRMRLSATRSLLERKDVIIVSSVSCIYGLGLPEFYSQMCLKLKIKENIRRDNVLMHLVYMKYDRAEDLGRATFRSRGDVLEIFPAYEEELAYRVEFWGNEIEKISEIDPLTGKKRKSLEEINILPGSHHVTPQWVRDRAVVSIKKELEEREAFFEKQNKFLEKQRISERTRMDLELIQEIGFCKGIENYSRHFSNRASGEPPPCLLDYFPKDYLVFIDESHQTIPQIRAMYNGDKARKQALVDFGFRLPSAYDNRPLKFEEFYERLNQVVYVSATPGSWEIADAQGYIQEQIIRPTGLLDPLLEVKPAVNQVDDCLEEIRKEIKKGGRVLVTTLTKRLSEELSDYLIEIGIKATYMHSDIDTINRIKIIHDLRLGNTDVLVGINLLREGLDIPEVSLVVILDADKEGFLRSETSLIQTFGRAARNSEGRVVMYADVITKSMRDAISITEKRRRVQEEYNKKHNIIPKTIKKGLKEEFFEIAAEEIEEEGISLKNMSQEEISKLIKEYEKQMKKAAKEHRFEDAIRFRERLKHYKNLEVLE